MGYLAKISVLAPVIMICFMKAQVVTLSVENIGLYLPNFGAVYSGFSILWILGISPLRKSKESGWEGVLYNLFPVEVFLFFVFLQHYFPIAVMLLLLFGILLLVYLRSFYILAVFTSGKKRRYCRKRFGKFFLVSTFLFTLIPGVVTVSEGIPCTVRYEAKDNSLSELVNETASIADGSADHYSRNRRILFSLKENVWYTYGLQERVDLLQNIVDMECSILGVPDPPRVVSLVVDDSIQTQYTESNEIQVSSKYLSVSSAEKATKAVLHQTFHAYQTYVIGSIDWESQYTDSFYFRQAKAWKENESSYLPAESDEYDQQPIEIDANNFTETEWKKIQNIIAEELLPLSVVRNSEKL